MVVLAETEKKNCMVGLWCRSERTRGWGGYDRVEGRTGGIAMSSWHVEYKKCAKRDKLSGILGYVRLLSRRICSRAEDLRQIWRDLETAERRSLGLMKTWEELYLSWWRKGEDMSYVRMKHWQAKKGIWKHNWFQNGFKQKLLGRGEAWCGRKSGAVQKLPVSTCFTCPPGM